MARSNSCSSTSIESLTLLPSRGSTTAFIQERQCTGARALAEDATGVTGELFSPDPRHPLRATPGGAARGAGGPPSASSSERSAQDRIADRNRSEPRPLSSTLPRTTEHGAADDEHGRQLDGPGRVEPGVGYGASGCLGRGGGHGDGLGG